MRKVIIFILAVILTLGIVFPASTAFAEILIPTATNDFYVNDFAGVFSEEEKTQLLDKAINLAKTKDGVQVVITTVDSLNGSSIEDYAVAMYNQYGIGKDDMGVLILLSTGDRQIRIEVGYAMEAYLTDSKVGELIDKYAIPYLRDNKFNEGLISLQDAVISEITTRIDKEEVVPVQDSNDIIAPGERISTIPVESPSSPSSNYFPWQVFIAVLILFIILVAYAFINIKRNESLKSQLDTQAKYFEESKRRDEQNHSSKIQNYESRIRDLGNTLRELRVKNQWFSDENSKLQEFITRARQLHPELDSEIFQMIAREEEEQNRQKAEEFDSSIEELLKSTASISIVPLLSSAFSRYNSLTQKQKAFVKSDISKLTALQAESRRLKEEDERKRKISRDKENARTVQSIISSAISGVNHGSASNLNRLRNAYNNYSYLDLDAKKYVDSSLVSRLNSLLSEAKRDQERIEEEKRRREEEERRRRRQREEERMRRSQSSFNHSSFGGSSHHSGFGGHSGGGGASRGF